MPSLASPSPRGSFARPLLVAWTLVVLLGLSLQLGRVPLMDPDEGRNAEVAREMAATGDYVVPHLNGLPYLDKPVLYFAAAAVAMEWLGPTEVAARLPALLAALLTALLAAWLAGHLFGPTAAWVAGLAAAASPLAVAFARTVIFDSLLSLCVVGAIAAFYRAIEQRRDAPERAWASLRWTIAAWVAIGFGVLTKGPVALALPLLVAIPYGLRRRASRAIWHPLGPLAFLVVVLPWVLAVSHRVPGFLRYALVTETFQRLTTGKLRRTGPVWYFLPYLLAGALPWSAAALASARGVWRRAERRLDDRFFFLLVWIVLPLAFFSLSQSKRPQYILPVLPAVAIWVGGAWQQAEDGEPLPGARTAAACWVALGTVFAAASQAARWAPSAVARMPVELAARLPATALALAALAIAGGLLAWRLRRHGAALLVALSLPVAALAPVTTPFLVAVGHQRSTERLAASLRPQLGESGEVVGVEAFRPSLPFYLRRPVILSTASAEELTSNYLAQSFDEWLRAPQSTLRPASWWRPALRGCSPEKPLVFVARAGSPAAAELARSLPRIGPDDRLAAFGPCPADGVAPAAEHGQDLR